VQDKAGIRSRLNNLYNNISDIESQIQQLYICLNESLDKYEMVENNLLTQATGKLGKITSPNALQFQVASANIKIPQNFLRALTMLVGVNGINSKNISNSFINLLVDLISGSKPNGFQYILGNEVNAKSALKKLGSFTNIISEITKNFSPNSKEKFGLATATFGYFSSLIGFFGEDKSGINGYNNLLKLTSSSTNIYSNIYSCIEKYSGAITAVNLSETWGRYIPAIGMYGNAVSFSQSVIKALSESGSGYDKASQWVGVVGAGTKFGGSISKFLSYSPKILQVSSSGELNISYKAVSAASKAKNISVYLRIATSGFSTISTGIKSYGNYSKDGSVDMGDIGAIGIDSSISGLNELFLFGLLDAEKVSGEIKDWAGGWGTSAGNYIVNNEELFNYYKNTNGFNKAALNIYAIGVTGVQGAGEAIGNAASTTGNAIKTGWTYVVDGYKEVFKLFSR